MNLRCDTAVLWRKWNVWQNVGSQQFFLHWGARVVIFQLALETNFRTRPEIASYLVREWEWDLWPNLQNSRDGDDDETRWMMMVIYPWWWSWWSGFVSARHFKKPQLAVKWANGGHPTSELQFFVSIQITEKNYIENFFVLSHRSILLTYSLLYLHSVLSRLFTHAGTLHII